MLVLMVSGHVRNINYFSLHSSYSSYSFCVSFGFVGTERAVALILLWGFLCNFIDM